MNNFIKKAFKSRIMVIIVTLITLGLFSAQTAANADDSSYVFGSVYQYYMLDNGQNAITTHSKKENGPLMGVIGSGGISGTFSYDDIVNSATSDVANSKQIAKSFVSMMATYSTFYYFSSKVEGFESVLSMVTRGGALLILIVPAILCDALSIISSAIIKIAAQVNIFPFLSNVMLNTNLVSQLEKAMNLPKNDIKEWLNILMLCLAAVLLITIFMALRRGGSNPDQRYVAKLKGQVLSLIAIPLAIGFSAELISSMSNTGDVSLATGNVFAQYLVDDRSWAYNFNFAPRGSGSGSSDIKPSGNSYVDLTFDPYTADGKQRINDINEYSTILGDHNNTTDANKKKTPLFANTSILMTYGTCLTFSATDYINYKGTAESQHLLGGGDATNTAGSYYQYSQNMKNNGHLIDVDHAYTGSDVADSNLIATGPFKSAIKDYNSGDTDNSKYNSSAAVAWRDRYIYVVKNSGSIAYYYKQQPSDEMIHTTVGADQKGNSLSDQTMYLVLSTIFNETGGRYYIEAPSIYRSSIKRFASVCSKI